MKDLEKLKKTFEDLGLEFKVHERKSEEPKYNHKDLEHDSFLRIERGVGYLFWMEFYFLKGKFVGHGLWE